MRAEVILALRLKVDMSVLKNNFAVLKKLTTAKVCAVVKADAYGHGLPAIQAFDDADEFAVSSIGEAYEMRDITDKPVNILSLPDKTVPCSYRSGIFPAVCSEDDIEFISSRGARAVNIKLNTGMNRYGAEPEELEALLFAAGKKRVAVKSVFSHIYSVSAAEEQFEKFMKCVSPFSDYIPQKHILASNFTILPQYMHLDMVRPGIVLYGYGHSCVTSAVTAVCGITQIREVRANENIGYGIWRSGKRRKVAVLGAGYADGLRRTVDNIPRYAEICGFLCPLVGQVCMDAAMADVSGLNAKVGDEARIIGSMYGCEALAASYGTICYEVITGFSKRVKREYIYESNTNEKKFT